MLMLFASGARAATNPWLGIWKLKVENSTQKPETLVYSDAGDGAMRMLSVEDESEGVTHFDGEPALDVGKSHHPERALAIKATSATSYAWIFTINGKPVAQGLNTLAKDLKTFKEVSWAVGDPKKTMTVIYERQ